MGCSPGNLCADCFCVVVVVVVVVCRRLYWVTSCWICSRFIGALVEDLARKNYHVLREAEIKANDLATVRALTTNLLDPVTRCQLNIYLALLHSTNVVCSNALFNTLTCLEPLHQCAALTLPGSVRLREEILLLFTMAANHPAFTFSQRQVLLEKLMVVQRILDCSDKVMTV